MIDKLLVHARFFRAKSVNIVSLVILIGRQTFNKGLIRSFFTQSENVSNLKPLKIDSQENAIRTIKRTKMGKVGNKVGAPSF